MIDMIKSHSLECYHCTVSRLLSFLICWLRGASFIHSMFIIDDNEVVSESFVLVSSDAQVYENRVLFDAFYDEMIY